MTRFNVLQLIDQAVKEQWKKLDLSRLDLIELPEEISELAHFTYLRELDLRFNRFTSLPLEVTQLASLRGLYLSGNRLQELPPEISKLTKLESLTLGGNPLRVMPPEIFKVISLKLIHCNNSELIELDSDINNLSNLEDLSLRNNLLKELPEDLGDLVNLRKLDLAENQLSKLPRKVGNLENLEELYLSNNKLKKLPETIGKLSKLKQFHLRGNHHLKSLPKTIIRIRKASVDTEIKFEEFNFRGHDLSGIDLRDVDLSNVILEDVNLRNVNLARVRALGTDFSGADFTGACIEDWHINSNTRFDRAVCEYIYLKEELQERRPSDHNRNFAPGEFITLVQEIRETVDLIFNGGVDWAALLSSINKLQIESDDSQLTIQAIEHKQDGRFVVRVNVPEDSDKAQVEDFFWRQYQNRLQAAEEAYFKQIEFKDEQLAFYKQQFIEYRQQNTDLMEMAKQMASRPLQIENKIENRNTHKGEQDLMSTINQYGSGDNIAGDKIAGDKIGTQINNSQDLTQAAKDIKTLLDQLSMDYPDDSSRVLGAKAVDRVEKSPELKSRILRGVRAGSFAALEKMVDHPVAKFFIEGAKEVLEP
ncbi:MAG: leucine-rich repeat domain-containing protein [Leptolyngbya sp. SIO1E4]|nr:leucine-rich repeat domain-containing protein [Leptolyngbya sp. SIO1E4]